MHRCSPDRALRDRMPEPAQCDCGRRTPSRGRGTVGGRRRATCVHDLGHAGAAERGARWAVDSRQRANIGPCGRKFLACPWGLCPSHASGAREAGVTAQWQRQSSPVHGTTATPSREPLPHGVLHRDELCVGRPQRGVGCGCNGVCVDTFADTRTPNSWDWRPKALQW